MIPKLRVVSNEGVRLDFILNLMKHVENVKANIGKHFLAQPSYDY